MTKEVNFITVFIEQAVELGCRAMRSQKVLDWCCAHKHMNTFYGGVSDYWMPDNLKSGVSKSDRYEPNIQETYEDMARHYQVAIVSARVRKPQDNLKVD